MNTLNLFVNWRHNGIQTLWFLLNAQTGMMILTYTASIVHWSQYSFQLQLYLLSMIYHYNSIKCTQPNKLQTLSLKFSNLQHHIISQLCKEQRIRPTYQQWSNISNRILIATLSGLDGFYNNLSILKLSKNVFLSAAIN